MNQALLVRSEAGEVMSLYQPKAHKSCLAILLSFRPGSLKQITDSIINTCLKRRKQLFVLRLTKTIFTQTTTLLCEIIFQFFYSSFR